MKRLFCSFLALVLLLAPVLSFTDSAYQPNLNMTVSDFAYKYNAVSTSLNSPLVPMLFDFDWHSSENGSYVSFTPDPSSSVSIRLFSDDPVSAMTSSAGLDRIQIWMNDEATFLCFVSVAIRCASVFSEDLFGTSIAPQAVASLLSYSYDNKTSGSVSKSLDAMQKYKLTFFHSMSFYCFQISANID